MYTVGIDLGTTNSVIAYTTADGRVEVIPNAEGKRITPSIVSFQKDGSIVVGELAYRQYFLQPERTVKSIKRKMGTDYKFRVDGKEYTPQEISAFILKKLKTDAESFLGGPITKAVITVPAYFNNSQREATKAAGEIAGLEVLRIINEPTAACLAYGINKDVEQKVLVFDLGGGTFDVSIIDVGDDVYQVLATSGDNHLGGDDWDKAIVDWLISEFKDETGIDLSQDKTALHRLYEAAIKAKIELSTLLETTISLPFITADHTGPKHLEKKLTRAKFESLTAHLLERLRGPLLQALKDANLKASDIDKVLLVGGSTRMPMVQKLIKDILNIEPSKEINPDECVAIGAAIQASIITGDRKDILLVDVTPLSLGVETAGGLFTKIIERNTTIPVTKKEIFTTVADNQRTVEIHVLQGERALAKDNFSLGRFYLEGIPPAPRGIPKIEVAFNIDVNGILHVTAKDLATGKEQSMRIESRNLTQEEIERMRQEAERFAEQDRQKRELIEAYNKLESLVYESEKFINENKDKVDCSKIEEVLPDAKKVLESSSEDKDAIDGMIDRLTKAIQDVATELYNQVQANSDEQKNV